MKQYLMEENLVKALVNYLGKRPWVEVEPFLHALNAMPEAPEKPAKTEAE